MKKWLASVFLLGTSLSLLANGSDSTIYYDLPDSVKGVQFMTEFKIAANDKKKFCLAGISTNDVRLYFDNFYRSRRIRFEPIGYAQKIANGKDVSEDLKYGYFQFRYDWKEETSYRFMIAMATDSAAGIRLYSGYVFLPEWNQWKLIGTYRFTGYAASISQPATFSRKGKKYNNSIQVSQSWIQRSNGSWKNFLGTALPIPMISLTGHADSVYQRQKEIADIESAIASGKTDARNNEQSVYYIILQQGSGRQVALTDTVTVHYKGSLFSDGSVFDQTRDKPARFPLQRLIRGWQIGVPLLKVGGKIKLVIPSDMAYSIRTRAAKIPPNSILVFEVEVLEARAPGEQ